MDESQLLAKTFPFFVVWHDLGELPCEGTSHARTEDEAIALAELRVLHGSFESFATIYKGEVKGHAKALRRYTWNDRQLIFDLMRKL